MWLDGEGPDEGPGHHDHLDGPGVEEALHEAPVHRAQALVHVRHSLGQGLTQRLVLTPS